MSQRPSQRDLIEELNSIQVREECQKQDVLDRLVGLAAFHGWSLDRDKALKILKKDE